MNTAKMSYAHSIRLEIVPVSLDEANAFVTEHHRHHGAVVGHKFSIGLADESGKMRGVAIVGRPVSRMADNGWTLEVNRCCTDGIRNGCSMPLPSCLEGGKSHGLSTAHYLHAAR